MRFPVMAAGVAAALMVSAPVMAQLTTFASYTQANAGTSLEFFNNGGGTATNPNNTGTGGSLFTTTNSNSSARTGVAILFNALAGSLTKTQQDQLQNLSATFNLGASVTTPTISAGGFKIAFPVNSTPTATNPGFSIIYNGPTIVLTGGNINGGSYTINTGANLLSGSFTNAAIGGQANGTSPQLSGSTGSGSTIVYTSDIYSFSNAAAYDFSINLTALKSFGKTVTAANSGLGNNTGDAYRSFRASSAGSFSSNPAPRFLGTATPEAATWAMMLVGFGAIGGTMRARRKQGLVAA